MKAELLFEKMIELERKIREDLAHLGARPISNAHFFMVCAEAQIQQALKKILAEQECDVSAFFPATLELIGASSSETKAGQPAPNQSGLPAFAGPHSEEIRRYGARDDG